MKVLTVRVEDELVARLDLIGEADKTDRAAAARRILAEGVQRWQTAQVLEEVRRGRITLRTAASRLGMKYWELIELVEREGIDSGYSLADLQEDLEATRP